MPIYQIMHDGQDWGRFSGPSMSEALLACLHDADRTRQYQVELLSHSENYGQGDGRMWGNGAQDRSRFWYVQGNGEIGVFSVAEPEL